MKRLATLAVLAAIAVAAIPATAQAAFVNRAVKTTCVDGTIYTVKAIDGTVRHTTIPCYGYVPNLSKPQYSVNRPLTDLYGAQQSANKWWPVCGAHWYAEEGPTQFNGRTWWFEYFTICTSG